MLTGVSDMAWILVIGSLIVLWIASLVKILRSSPLPSNDVFLSNGGLVNILYGFMLSEFLMLFFVYLFIYSREMCRLEIRRAFEEKCLVGCCPPRWWVHVRFKTTNSIWIIYDQKQDVSVIVSYNLLCRIFWNDVKGPLVPDI